MSIRYYALKLGLYFVYSGNIVVPFAERNRPRNHLGIQFSVAIYNLSPSRTNTFALRDMICEARDKAGPLEKRDRGNFPRVRIPESHRMDILGYRIFMTQRALPPDTGEDARNAKM